MEFGVVNEKHVTNVSIYFHKFRLLNRKLHQAPYNSLLAYATHAEIH